MSLITIGILKSGLELIINGNDAVEAVEKLIGFYDFIKKNVEFDKAFYQINNYYRIINYVDIEKRIDELDVKEILTAIENSEDNSKSEDTFFKIVNTDSFKKELKRYIKCSDYQLFKNNITKYLEREKTSKNIVFTELKIEWYILLVLTVLLCLEKYNDDASKLINSRQRYIIMNMLTNIEKKMDNYTNTDKDIEDWSEVNKILKDDTYLANKDKIEEIREKFENNIQKVAQIGYVLADIYERNGEFAKSLKIIKEITGIYKTMCEQALKDNNLNSTEMQKKLRNYIGCIYSFAISDVEEREKLLEIGEKEFRYANDLKELFIKNENYEEVDKKFILALYYSDFGALNISIGKLKRKKEEVSEAKKYFEKGKEIHQYALEVRNDLESILQKTTVDKEEKGFDKISVKRSIGVSLRNIATTNFYLREYHESVLNNEKAIKIFDQLKEETDYFHALDCVTGSYIELFKSDREAMTEKSVKNCCLYIKSILRYYHKHTEHIRYKNAIKRKELLIEMSNDIKDDRILEEIEILKD